MGVLQLWPEGRNARGGTRPGKPLRGPGVALQGPRREVSVGNSEASKRPRFPGCPLRGFQPSGSYPRATDKFFPPYTGWRTDPGNSCSQRRAIPNGLTSSPTPRMASGAPAMSWSLLRPYHGQNMGPTWNARHQQPKPRCTTQWGCTHDHSQLVQLVCGAHHYWLAPTFTEATPPVIHA